MLDLHPAQRQNEWLAKSLIAQTFTALCDLSEVGEEQVVMLADTTRFCNLSG